MYRIKYSILLLFFFFLLLINNINGNVPWISYFDKENIIINYSSDSTLSSNTFNYIDYLPDTLDFVYTINNEFNSSTFIYYDTVLKRSHENFIPSYNFTRNFNHNCKNYATSNIPKKSKNKNQFAWYYSGNLMQPEWRNLRNHINLDGLFSQTLEEIPIREIKEGKGEESIIQPISSLNLLPKLSIHSWVGPKNAHATLHYDGVHNLFIQLSGSKRMTLYPPSEVLNNFFYGNLHPHSCQSRKYFYEKYKQSLIPKIKNKNTMKEKNVDKIEKDDEIIEVQYNKYHSPYSLLLSRPLNELEYKDFFLYFSKYESSILNSKNLSSVSVDLNPYSILYIPPYWLHEATSLGSSQDEINEPKEVEKVIEKEENEDETEVVKKKFQQNQFKGHQEIYNKNKEKLNKNIDEDYEECSFSLSLWWESKYSKVSDHLFLLPLPIESNWPSKKIYFAMIEYLYHFVSCLDENNKYFNEDEEEKIEEEIGIKDKSIINILKNRYLEDYFLYTNKKFDNEYKWIRDYEGHLLLDSNEIDKIIQYSHTTCHTYQEEYYNIKHNFLDHYDDNLLLISSKYKIPLINNNNKINNELLLKNLTDNNHSYKNKDNFLTLSSISKLKIGDYIEEVSRFTIDFISEIEKKLEFFYMENNNKLKNNDDIYFHSFKNFYSPLYSNIKSEYNKKIIELYLNVVYKLEARN